MTVEIILTIVFFAPIIDKIEEVRYIRKHENGFDPDLKEFVSSEKKIKEIEIKK